MKSPPPLIPPPQKNMKIKRLKVRTGVVVAVWGGLEHCRRHVQFMCILQSTRFGIGAVVKRFTFICFSTLFSANIWSLHS